MEFIFILLLVIFIVYMCIMCRHYDIAKIISLFLILISIQCGVYIYSEYDFLSALILSIGDVAIYSILLMSVPIGMKLYNGKKFENKKGKKICKINSFIVWIVLIFLSSLLKTYNIPISLNVGWIGAIIYYYINYFITTKKEEKQDEEIEILYE